MRARLAVLVVVIAGLSASLLDAAETPLWREGISLIPYPQEAALVGDAFVIDSPIAIVLDAQASEADRFAAQDLAGRISLPNWERPQVSDSDWPVETRPGTA